MYIHYLSKLNLIVPSISSRYKEIMLKNELLEFELKPKFYQSYCDNLVLYILYLKIVLSTIFNLSQKV